MSEFNTKSLPEYPGALHTLNDAMKLSSSRESYEIRRALLYNAAGESREIYLIALRGTNRSLDPNDVLGVPVCLRSFVSKPNLYFEKAKKAVLADVPQGAAAVFMGHSLGGMIAQQLCNDEQIKAHCEILTLLNIGSPYVKLKGITCPFRRFAERADFIPWLGFSVKANLVTHKPVFKNNGYFGKPVLAHTDAYSESDSWREYDCLGIQNGGHVIVF